MGCVDAEDQLQHEEYVEFSDVQEERIRNGAARDEWVWPPEENGSEYVFICHRPRQLVVPVNLRATQLVVQLCKIAYYM